MPWPEMGYLLNFCRICVKNEKWSDKIPNCHLQNGRHFFLFQCDNSQIAKLMEPTWGPPGSCRPQMGPMLAPWTLLSGLLCMSWYDIFLYRWVLPLSLQIAMVIVIWRNYASVFMNPWLPEFVLQMIMIYWHVLSFSKTLVVLVVEILASGRLGPVYPVSWISWLLIICEDIEPGHLQPWYWSHSSRIFQFQHQDTRHNSWWQSCLETLEAHVWNWHPEHEAIRS